MLIINLRIYVINTDSFFNFVLLKNIDLYK